MSRLIYISFVIVLWQSVCSVQFGKYNDFPYKKENTQLRYVFSILVNKHNEVMVENEIVTENSAVQTLFLAYLRDVGNENSIAPPSHDKITVRLMYQEGASDECIQDVLSQVEAARLIDAKERYKKTKFIAVWRKVYLNEFFPIETNVFKAPPSSSEIPIEIHEIEIITIKDE